MLNEDLFNAIGFNANGAIKKLITLIIDTLFKKKNISKSISSDLIIVDKFIRSFTSDLIIRASDKSRSTTCDLIIQQRYVEKINLRSYLKSVEDVYLGIEKGKIIVSRMSKIHS